MNCSVDVALRQVEGIAEAQTQSTTTKQDRDAMDREEPEAMEVGCVYGIFELFVLYSQG